MYGLSSILHDLRYAIRLLRNSPGFSAVAIAAIAGINSAPGRRTGGWSASTPSRRSRTDASTTPRSMRSVETEEEIAKRVKPPKRASRQASTAYVDDGHRRRAVARVHPGEHARHHGPEDPVGDLGERRGLDLREVRAEDALRHEVDHHVDGRAERDADCHTNEQRARRIGQQPR
jgi:hypothetical protein